jgi:adenosylmethionine-8-amino-7-oxononanoate aminotransferase
VSDSNNDASRLLERDAEALWHPATHFRDLERLPVIPVVGAEGCELITADGRRILDGISSWWTSIHGHGHPVISEAIARQARTLDHVMFAGFTHAPAVDLAEQLLDLAPNGYGKVFYSDCGSASIEVAMKLSYQSRVQRGETERRRFAALHNSYHGETMGALSVCGSDAYRELFSPLLIDVLYLPGPRVADHAHAQLGEPGQLDEAAFEEACRLLEANAHELTALVVEPLVQCAGKMTMTGSAFYEGLVHKAQSLGIHVIADEIAVGFGRTGRLFASDWTDAVPDLLCLSKGLSGGVLPLAATLIREGFEEDFKGSPSRSFMHSHTYTGNPIACAAGVASLELLCDEVLPRLDERVELMRQKLEEVREACPAVAHLRQCGMIGALELQVGPQHPGPADGRLGLALRQAALSRDLLLRPLHDTVYWMPPLSISDDEFDRLTSGTIDVIRDVLS